MATDIVQSLFGMTPDSYQQNQQAKADERMLQFAKLDPFQQANYSIGRGAYGLAGAVGGALGGQDPELQRITMRQQIAGQINPNDPASIERGIVALQQGGDSQGAFMLQGEYRKMQESGALVGQRDAAAKASLAQAGRKRVQASPKEAQLAALVARRAGPEGSAEYEAAFYASLEQQMAPKEAKGPGFGAEAERYANSMFGGKTFSMLTPDEAALVNKAVDEKAKGVAREGAAKFTYPLAGVKGAPDIVGLRSTINTTLKPYRDGLNAANSAIEQADEVLKTGNFAIFAALSRALAKASGETQLSKSDVAAFGSDPSFIGSIADMANKLATGVPTPDTTRRLKALAVLLKKKNEALEKDEIKVLRNTARDSGLYTEAQIQNVFTLRGESKGTTRKTAGGVSYTVED